MKNKILLGILSFSLVVGLVACKDETVNPDSQQENNNEVSQGQQTNNDAENEENDLSGDPKDVLGNKIDFNDILEYTTVNGVSYQIAKDGTKLIDTTTQNERTINGFQGTVKSFLCEAETESKEDMLNFMAINEEGKLFVAHIENASETTINFSEVEYPEKIISMGVAKVGYENHVIPIAKDELGRLMKIICFYEEAQTTAVLIDYVPADEKTQYNTYMKLMGEYEFVESKKIEGISGDDMTPVFEDGVKLVFENPIPHGVISLSTIIDSSGDKVETFWWEYSVPEKIARLYFTNEYKNYEEITFTYEEKAEGIVLKVRDKQNEMIFKKKI